MKLNFGLMMFLVLGSRTPQGVRGLKSFWLFLSYLGFLSHPARGAWIEIIISFVRWVLGLSHPARGAWIEILLPL